MIIGILPMPYGYYTLSRFIVCACAAYYAYQCSKNDDRNFLLIFGFIAILYNPIIPVHLYEKWIWIIVNIFTGYFFYLKRNY